MKTDVSDLGRLGECALLAMARKGDQLARNEIVSRNLGLVGLIARSYGRRRDFQDIFQEGVLGLMRAIQGYDPASGCKLSTYAAIWIRERIGKYIRDDGPIRVAAHVRRLDVRERAGEELPLRQARMLVQARQAWEAAVDVADVQPAACGPGPGEAMDRDEDMRLLNAALSELDALEHEVVASTYGLGGMRPRPQRAMAFDLGCSKGEIVAIQDRALGRLREDVTSPPAGSRDSLTPS
jgi:RNA polymerase primary sigma factor